MGRATQSQRSSRKGPHAQLTNETPSKEAICTGANNYKYQSEKAQRKKPLLVKPRHASPCLQSRARPLLEGQTTTGTERLYASVLCCGVCVFLCRALLFPPGGMQLKKKNLRLSFMRSFAKKKHTRFSKGCHPWRMEL